MNKLFLNAILLLLLPHLSQAGIFGCNSSKHVVCSDKNKNYHLVHTAKDYGSCLEALGYEHYFEFRNNITGEVIVHNEGTIEGIENETKVYKGYNTHKESSFFIPYFHNVYSNVTVSVVDKNENLLNVDMDCKDDYEMNNRPSTAIRLKEKLVLTFPKNFFSNLLSSNLLSFSRNVPLEKLKGTLKENEILPVCELEVLSLSALARKEIYSNGDQVTMQQTNRVRSWTTSLTFFGSTQSAVYKLSCNLMEYRNWSYDKFESNFYSIQTENEYTSSEKLKQMLVNAHPRRGGARTF